MAATFGGKLYLLFNTRLKGVVAALTLTQSICARFTYCCWPDV